MLLTEQGGRAEDGNLFATGHCGKRGTQGNFGFTKAHIATDQTIHGLA